MASTSETGHAKNIANLNELNQINAGLTDYAPTNPLIMKPAMVLQHTNCSTLQGIVNTQNGIFLPIRSARIAEFKPLKPLARRIRSFAKSCGGAPGFYTNVNTVIKKILGDRVSNPVSTPDDPAGTSASQQSYDNMVDHWDEMVEILKNEPAYTPNKVDLQIVSLEAKQVAITAKNNAVKAGVMPYNTAIINRNKALYTTKTGLVDVGQDSKDYVRSTYGFSSPEFKLVTKIKFRKLADVD